MHQAPIYRLVSDKQLFLSRTRTSPESTEGGFQGLQQIGAVLISESGSPVVHNEYL